MSGLFSRIAFVATVFGLTFFPSCSKHDEEVRTPADIIGIWSPSDSYYIEFNDDNTTRVLEISVEDDEKIGTWSDNVYFYEPGYNLVIYLDFPRDIEVYQILSLTQSKMEWCWVKSLKDEYSENDSLGSIVGDIIKEAQEGFTLNPELYQTFVRISEDEFLDILENINIMEPW